MRLTLIVAAGLTASLAQASEDIADKYPQSELYDKPVEVIPHVFSAIGATAPPTYENSGHNNNLSFVLTGDGVVVINSGASARLAKALHDEIKMLTDQPVKLVINENGQGHAMLGNSYWAGLGVDILAHEDAIAEVEKNGDFILQGMQRYNRDKAEGTEVVVPNLSFSDQHIVEMGDVTLEVLHLGPAHDPGDAQVWIPQWGIVIAGDIAFHERMPPIFPETDTDAWVETFEGPFTDLGATYVIPGHGHPTNMAQVTRYTSDYINDLRAKIGAHIEEGGDLASAYYVDQSNWEHLDTFEELATKNAGRVFEEMEWE
ncbi:MULTISPECIES: MBL fold metallo-hydrolase [Marivita]|jgi:glyoxylase-like metal-dependent hydrolase (beta-lactamase superfamily II)|uniref:MBL fold metallo-hydrolase n=1 Tax=Marivita cryptomonadis TaxID=505252 RepID=A0A9Q2RXT3_9RHOB|nr:MULTISPECIES: MBL fold metallo-hydrolase [Marivita]MCR9169233.1 MBL fold metallo-hydrolase [Paracoccaceae bacterium]MBM2322172.1 MBL fold metallo-hydrolase [Marivita cryptomonadis]MBM2331753.1 MBL fold metallo-hydrolase [Marivita cryptomonadis]MBM2341338.1 MBL fold metallo-hydrolase [Marivita cryptomonadis]MBM2346001.1 MBL fold metallo-hydrolase [Marivita cryptomonadis]